MYIVRGSENIYIMIPTTLREKKNQLNTRNVDGMIWLVISMQNLTLTDILTPVDTFVMNISLMQEFDK